MPLVLIEQRFPDLSSMEPSHTISNVVEPLDTLKHIILKNEFVLKIYLYWDKFFRFLTPVSSGSLD